ncbi:anti-sigma factor family protein [Neorhodopirellula pilleata]|uniref:Zinc-finger domain-containing protein n=1 Tax=Neorhodopirellula pilleata TaxID=2714738 RepID=A0A5C5ZKR7_9BACT|nr:hypothetical protein [Neorhodopirellula pilleata]TWT87969.1 hypothetical protein Pla100_58210 [Neorhodopirellula pilleata]
MSDLSVIDDELLVAYLDGELPRDERGKLEQRLVSDESLRLRLQSLQRGWDLLDLLPSPVTTEYSVQSTLELVVADIDRASNAPSPKFPAGRLRQGTVGASSESTNPSVLQRTSWFLIPLAAITLSFMAMRAWQYRTAIRDANDFPVAIDIDAYTIADNESLIDDLMASPRWRSVVAEPMLPDVQALVATSPTMPELKTALAQLPDDQRLMALSRWERFERLDRPTQDQLRAAAEEVSQQPDAAERLQTIRDYSRWRGQLRSETVAAIEQGSGDERQAAIEAAIAETITSIGQATGRNLSEEAIERIDFTLVQIVKSRFSHIDFKNEEKAREIMGDRMSKLFGPRTNRISDPNMVYRMIARGIVFPDPGRSATPLDSRELDLIHSMLPAKDAEVLQPYVSDPWMRSMILQDWAQETIHRKLRGRTKPPTLAERYESLPASEQEAIDLMPPDIARRRLLETSQ